jgi:hypothetical protein
MLQTPPAAIPMPPDIVQASPATWEVQAATASAGGVMLRPQTRVVPSPAVVHVPGRVSPNASVTVQASPEALPEQAATSSWGGPGGVGAQATVVPSMAVRQVPSTVTVAPVAVEVSVQASPATFPAHASM